ncbi:glycosyltransferase family A protein [Zhenhengia yiwuensis]|uniref:glycosyltransferase family 2 protein n=1 Tax=Zhenhengia yiwuensis TaxID=2763666 RepID=UPI002A7640EC|nr:glycosyltransferase family A protein [Zhenhengia yiwuensis]MDY3367235.1 glycosyltransferase family A protein [Zhenhengia yiwuensis]
MSQIYIRQDDKEKIKIQIEEAGKIQLIPLVLVNVDIKLGEVFKLSYQVLLTLKPLLKKGNIITLHFECTYIIMYFTLQYIWFGGEDLAPIKVDGNKAKFSAIEGDSYRFPWYWIQKCEQECEELLQSSLETNIEQTHPKLSIIIPYFNLGEYIHETLESLSGCNYSNLEIIIVNDGTTDEKSLKALDNLRRDERYRIIDQVNQGLSAARNAGVKVAQGKYITFLDADDQVASDYYTRAIKVLERHYDIDIVYSWVKFFEAKNDIWPTFNLKLPYLLLSNMSAAFYVVRKNAFIEFGMNRVEMQKGMEDYDSLIRMHINGCKGVAIPEALSYYRYRMDSMSKAFNPDVVINIYNQIVEQNMKAYEEYSIEIIKLMNANGPGYLWNNPSLNYPSVVLNANEDIHDIKYILIRLLNTHIGRIAIKILKCYKNKVKK